MADNKSTTPAKTQPKGDPTPPDSKTHLVAQATVDAVLVLSPWQLPINTKVAEAMKRIRAVSNEPVEVREYIPATPTDYGVPENSVTTTAQSPHVVFFFPKESGYELLHTAGFIGSSVKLNLKAAHEGAFNIVQLRTRDHSIAYRLTFVESGIVKKIEPIFYETNGLSIRVEPQEKNAPKPRPMIFPSWLRLLKQLGHVAKHLLYISIPKEMLNKFTEIPSLPSSLSANETSSSILPVNQLYVLNVTCSYSTTTHISGPKNDGLNFSALFTNLGKHPQIEFKNPQLKDLVSPGLQEILSSMDVIYINAGKGDTVVFYFSGYGRQIFRPEPQTRTNGNSGSVSNSSSQLQQIEEPIVGLMPSDATFDTKEIHLISDLTNVWIRYWINALYLIKGVASVVIILDTSFSDPGSDYHKSIDVSTKTVVAHVKETREEVMRIRSHRPHIMSDKCTLDLPKETITDYPSWFEPGKALDDPSDSLRAYDNINESPYYFAPSRQWATKHVVLQASRDIELAYERKFFAVQEEMQGPEVALRFEPHGTDEGKFSYYLRGVLQNYIEQNNLETWPLAMARLNGAGKDVLDNQHPICWIGNCKRDERIFSPTRIPQVYSSLAVEASNNGNIWNGTGFLGLPTPTEGLQLKLAKAHGLNDPKELNEEEQEKALRALATPVQPGTGFDPYLQEYQIIPGKTDFERTMQQHSLQVGKSMQVMPIIGHELTIAVPHGTTDNDPELASVANTLRQELFQKGIAKNIQLLEHEASESRQELWEWNLFDFHPWGRTSKERMSEVRLFAVSLNQKSWTEIEKLTRDFVNNLRTRIYDSISKDVASKVHMTCPDISNCQRIAPPEAKDYRITLLRFRSWLLERSEDIEYAETVNATNRVVLFQALRSLADAVDKAPVTLTNPRDHPFIVTVCRNNVIPPTEDAHSLRRRFGLSHRLLAPVATMASLRLSLKNGVIKQENVGSYLAPNEEHWKSQQTIANTYPQMNGRKEMVALYWLNFYDFLAPSSSPPLLDAPEWLQLLESPFLQSGDGDLKGYDNEADLAQAHVLAGCFYLTRAPHKALDAFDSASTVLARIGNEEAALGELVINKMLAYISFNDTHEHFNFALEQACLLLTQIAQQNQRSQLKPEGSLACLYTLARLSECLSTEHRLEGGNTLWPISPEAVDRLKLPAWSAVAEFVIRQYVEMNKESTNVNSFSRIAYKHNIALLEEAVGNYPKALAKLTKVADAFKTFPLPNPPQELSIKGSGAIALRKELRTFVLVNIAIIRSLFTRENVISLTEKDSHSLLSTTNLSSIFILEWAHYLKACDSTQTDSVYNAVRSETSRIKQNRSSVLFLKKIIANYQLYCRGRVTKSQWSRAAGDCIKLISSRRRNILPSNISSTPVPQPGSQLDFEIKNDAIALPSLMMGSLLPIYQYYNSSKEKVAKDSLSKTDNKGIYGSAEEEKWRSLDEDDFKGIRQFALEMQAPFIGSFNWQITSLLVLGRIACDFRNYRIGLQFFTRIFDRLDVSNANSGLSLLSSHEKDQLIAIGGEYTRFANRQSQFFLSSIPPHDIDAFHCKPDKDTNSTSYLCPPMERTGLGDVAALWYWRAVKYDCLINAQLRRIPGVQLGYRRSHPTPQGLGVSRAPLPENQFSLDPKLGPINMSISVVTKIATAVPRACALLLHDSERIELKVQHRDALNKSEMEACKTRLAAEKRISSSPFIRFRFHVLDGRQDGTIKQLTRGTNLAGHAINIPLHTPDCSTTVRLGAITTQHEPIDIYFRGSIYELSSPLTHVFVLMIREDDDAAPPLFDPRFFEQTAFLDLDAYTRCSAIRQNWERMTVQFDQRLLTKYNSAQKIPAVTDGDTFHVEWFRIRSLPQVNPLTKLFRPSSEVRSRVFVASGKKDTYQGFLQATPSTATGRTRCSPLTYTNEYSHNIHYVPVNVNPGLVAATPNTVQPQTLVKVNRTELPLIEETDKVYSCVPDSFDSRLVRGTSLAQYSTTKGAAESAPLNANYVVVPSYLGTTKERDSVIESLFKTAKSLISTSQWNEEALVDLSQPPTDTPWPAQLTESISLPDLGTDNEEVTVNGSTSTLVVNPLFTNISSYVEQLRETAYLLECCIISFNENPPSVIVVDATSVDHTHSLSNVTVKAEMLNIEKDAFLQKITARLSDSRFESELYDLLFTPIEHWLPLPAVGSLTPPLLVITSHGGSELFRIPYGALLSPKIGQYLTENYLISMQSSIKTLQKSIASFTNYHLPNQRKGEPVTGYILKSSSGDQGKMVANMLPVLWKGIAPVLDYDKILEIQGRTLPFGGPRPHSPIIKFVHVEGFSEEVGRSVAISSTDVETFIQCDLVGAYFPPSSVNVSAFNSVICSSSTLGYTRFHGFYARATRLELSFEKQFWTSIENGLPQTVIPNHKIQNISSVKLLVDVFSTIAMCHLALQDLDSTIQKRIHVIPSKPPLVKVSQSEHYTLNEQLAQIILDIHRYDAFSIGQDELYRQPIAAGHLSVLKREAGDAYYWYSTVASTSPASLALKFTTAIIDREVVEIASIPQTLASVCHSMVICSTGSQFPRNFSRLATSLQSLKDSTLDLLHQTNEEFVGKSPGIDTTQPQFLGLSALASFLAWDLGDAQYKCELALGKLSRIPTPATETLSSVLLAPLKKALLILEELLGTILPAAKTFYRQNSKVALVRDTQLKLAGISQKQAASSFSLSTSSIAPQPQGTWGGLFVYGAPYNPTEIYFMRPERQKQLLDFTSRLNTSDTI